MLSATFVLVVLLSYMFGSIPSGVILSRWFIGQDVRQLGSGRTGMTNVMRAGGFRLGLLTGVFDALKAVPGVWLAQSLLPASHWTAVVAGLAAVLGHNYSFL